MEKKIKNIVFDLGGVLIDLDRQRCVDSFKKLGLEHVDELIGDFSQQGIFMQLEKGLVTADVFRDRVCELSGKAIADEVIDEAWNSFLVRTPTYKLDALLALRGKYIVYLLSNTNEIHWNWACQHGFSYKGFTMKDYFEEVFLSYELKQAKPDPEIFRSVIERAGILPEETFFIDDSKANCLAASELGIVTYCAQPGEDWTHLFA